MINGTYSDDMLFLRQLILDGQWDDVLEFVQPLMQMEGFESKKFQFAIVRHKYLELLCLKSEPGPMQNNEFTVDEVVQCLNSLEEFCPGKEVYNGLCLLLTLPRLSDHPEYKTWNPSSARVGCFCEVHPLLEKFMPVEKHDDNVAKNDRMIQLLLKGMLYESCVEFCQRRATGASDVSASMIQTKMLNGTGFSSADLSLLSWLQSIPPDTFSCPFEQRNLSVDVEPLLKPQLDASWSEHILTTPIKPNIFPHTAVPSSRPHSAELMSRSLAPQYDGLACGLAVNRAMSYSVTPEVASMSKSFAGFHLSASKRSANPMSMSIDRMFDEADMVSTGQVTDGDQTRQPTRSKSPLPAGSKLDKSKDSMQQSVEKKTGGRDSSELYKEYQKQKQLLQEQLEQQDKQRVAYQEQLMDLENKQHAISNDNRYSYSI